MPTKTLLGGRKVTEYLGTREDLSRTRRRRGGGAVAMHSQVKTRASAGSAQRLSRPLRTRALTEPIDFPIVAAPQWSVRLARRVIIADFCLAVAASLVSYLARFGTDHDRNVWIAVFTPFLWVTVLWAMNTYKRETIGIGFEEYRAIARGSFLSFSMIAMVSYIWNFQLARGFVLPMVVLVPVGAFLVHWTMRTKLFQARTAGHSLLDTIVVGRADSVEQLVQEIQRTPAAGYRVIGACASGLDANIETDRTIAGVPILGRPEDALVAVDTYGAHVVAVSSHPDLVGHSLRRLGWSLAERQVDLVISPGIVEVAGPRLSLRPAAGISLLAVERPVDGGPRMVAKRIMDIAIITKVTSGGPVFFVQERVGAHGRTFRMIKFRSMVVDAEARLDEIPRDGQTNEILFKDKLDPRITPFGRVLRKFSLDELPQLINIIKGDMSLVGPRPPLAHEVAKYESDAMQRLRVRPGLTGLWQISGRSDLDWEESLRLDLWYVDNWNPLLDLKIILSTFKAVAAGRGAY